MKLGENSNNEFKRFKDARILVTGGAGFVGSHLTEKLVQLGAHVLVLDDMSCGIHENLTAVKDQITLQVGSVSDSNLVDSLMKKHEPEFVFHLAAQNLVLSIRNPRLDAMVTIFGLLNLLEAMRRNDSTEVLIHSSTGSVYGEPLEFPQTESHVRIPSSPYGVSKLAAEEYLRIWKDLYSVDYVALRYYNVYGPRQSSNEATGGGVIPVFANRLLAGQPLRVEWTGKQQRCFTYVSDVVRSNLLAATRRECWCDYYNIATDEKTDILSLANLMMEVSGVHTEIEFASKRPGDIKYFEPSIELAKQKMNYTPRTKLHEGLQIYLEWLKSTKAP